MECNFNQDLLHEYLDHELDPLMQIILEEHLAVCPDCQRELNQLKILDWDLRFADQMEIPKEELAKIRNRALEQCFADEKKLTQNSLRDAYRIQTQAAGYAVNYLHFIPGASLLKKSGQASAEFLGKKLRPSRLLFAGRKG
ncbi:MAG: zf-HC2 domain-containing protein [Syntrophomonadaceae bacterium]|nr:zf-HC2 domain-containing protein [Syntrophomonadaceae bacterium]